ncbi:MAG: penicillin-binding transpeptidase domain-containing protein, partial [bacterium]
NDGKLMPAIAITKIEDSKGNVLESADTPTESPAPAAQVEAGAAEEPKAEAGKKVEGRQVSEDELNTALFEQNRKWLEKDKLNLTDLEIKTLYGTSIPPGHVMTPQTAFLMVNLLKGVVESGTGTRVKPLGKPTGGKTGTTNDETDCWFIGFVPDLVAGVWVGYDEITRIAHGATGGTIAAPIFLDFMKNAIGTWEAKDFPTPDGFPMEKMASLTGGSAIAGAHANVAGPAPRGGSDRAGEFFEEDYERGGGEGL